MEGSHILYIYMCIYISTQNCVCPNHFFFAFLLLGYLEDIDEELLDDTTKCFGPAIIDGKTVSVPINAQGHQSEQLLAKNELSFFTQLFCPLQSMGSLIPSNIDIGITIHLTKCKTYTHFFLFFIFFLELKIKRNAM